MSRWEYCIRYINILDKKFYGTESSATDLWRKQKAISEADFVEVAKLGSQGWELVSTTLVSEVGTKADGYSHIFLFTFKRQIS